MSIITLTTDFGLQDTYVGQMKGAILSIVPTVTMVDLSHAVSPQNVLGGAVILKDSVGAFPDDTSLTIVEGVQAGDELLIQVGAESGIFSNCAGIL